MIKTTVARASLVAIAFLLSACGGDSAEKVMADQFQHWEDLTEVLNDIAAGGDSSKAEKRLKELGVTAREIEQRKKKLFGELGSVERQQAESEFAAEALKAVMKLTEAIQKVGKSGNLTAKMEQEIMHMKAK